MSQLKGFLFPQSPKGIASLIPNPPWYYSGTWLTIEYRTDPERVKALLPEPLELVDDDPGRVAIVWADWQSCSDGGAEMLDPVRAQYAEAFIAVKVKFQGKVYSRIVHIWVDRDFSLGRGIHMGYPKKFGSIYQTRAFPYGPAPRLAPGGCFGASLASYDRRIAQGTITLKEQVKTGGPTVNIYPLLHSRILRSIEKDGGESLNELVTHKPAKAEAGDPWVADATLELFESPCEELADLPVREIMGGYYQQMGTMWDGGEMLLDNRRK